MAETLPGTVVQAGAVVPGAALHDLESGREVRPWSFRHRAAVVLCFLHRDCETCRSYLASLRDEEDDVTQAGARLVAVDGDAPTFLHDGPPVILVVDRYGGAWRSYPAPDHQFPAPSELVATVWHLATMCPECGVSTW
jgi:hypothetical protein